MGVAVICRVSYYREYHGLTQRELAVQARTGNSSIAEIESGKRLPNVLLAIRIARVLQMYQMRLRVSMNAELQHQKQQPAYEQFQCSLR